MLKATAAGEARAARFLDGGGRWHRLHHLVRKGVDAVERIRAFGEVPEEGAELAAAQSRARERLVRHPWPARLLAALERLAAGGHSAFLVGGTVRDVLVGRGGDPTFDVATDVLPGEVMKRFARVEPLGLEHGTVLIVEEDLRLECTTFRREGAYPDARHPERVEFTADPLEDLKRRDLTVNAIAFDPRQGILLDPQGGTLDLERGILRAVGVAAERFREDALRPLRVARLAAVLEMDPEAATRAALGLERQRASWVAWERVYQEMVKLMLAPRPSIGFELLREAGLLDLWLPELARCYGVPQNRFHAYDVYLHSLYTCDAAPIEKPRVRWAALLHDVGKPDTRVERKGEGTFYNHEIVGAELADRMLERLRFPAADRRWIVHLVREHMFDVRREWTDAALRRWLRRVGIDAVADLFDLRIADVLGNGLKAGFPFYLEELRDRIERLLEESQALSVHDLEVNGHDVMRVLGIPPGRSVGRALEALLEGVLDRPEENQRARLLERLEQWRREGSAGRSKA